MRDEEPGVRLASIHIYPMKAARAVDLGESLVEPWGLAGDRRWLLVDEDGRFVSQREEPSLARVVVTPLTGTISVASAGVPGRQIAAPAAGDGANMLKVTVWGSAVLAAAAGPAGDAWFSAYLGRSPAKSARSRSRCSAWRCRFGEQLVFGQNMIPEDPGLIRAGNPVEVLATA